MRTKLFENEMGKIFILIGLDHLYPFANKKDTYITRFP